MPISVSSRRTSRISERAGLPPCGCSVSGEVEEGLVDRQGLNQRRQFQHHGADLTAYRLIFFHVGRQNNRVRA